MPVKTIPLLFIFLLNAGSLMLSADEKQPVGQSDPKNTQTASPYQETKSRYFQDSGSRMDSLVDRIWIKITYSWNKSAEYFHLACSAAKESGSAKKQETDAPADSKKDVLLEKGRQAVRETTQQAMKDISRKGEELRQDMNKMGREVKDNAVKEVRENTDQLFK